MQPCENFLVHMYSLSMLLRFLMYHDWSKLSFLYWDKYFVLTTCIYINTVTYIYLKTASMCESEHLSSSSVLKLIATSYLTCFLQGKISFKNLKRVAKELGENLTDEELQVRTAMLSILCFSSSILNLACWNKLIDFYFVFACMDCQLQYMYSGCMPFWGLAVGLVWAGGEGGAWTGYTLSLVSPN